MKIRHKETGKIVEIMEGAIYPEQFYEKVTEDDDIKVGEPKVEYVIEEYQDSGADAKEADAKEAVVVSKMEKSTKKKPATKKAPAKAKKGVKKNDDKKERN